MRTIWLTIILILMFASCDQKRQRPSVKGWRLTFDSLLANKDILNATDLADSVLRQMKDDPDSLHTYITTSLLLYDSAVSRWGIDKKQAEKYLHNIIEKASVIHGDTALIKQLATAYYRVGMNLFSLNPYNDTLVAAWENYLLLNEKNNLNQWQRAAYVHMRLGISYNIAGDIRKSLEHSTLGESWFSSLQDNDNFVACINNKLIAFNEWNKFDSTIANVKRCASIAGVHPMIRALQLACLAEAEWKKGFMNEGRQDIEESIRLINGIVDTTYDPDLLDRRSQIFLIKYQIEKMLNNTSAANHFIGLSIRMERMKKQKDAVPRQLAKRLLALAADEQQMGRYDTALKLVHEALAKVVPVDPMQVIALPTIAQLSSENTIMEALDQKAELFELFHRQNSDLNFLATAVQCYARSFEVERKLLQYFSYDESKLLMLNESRLRSQKAISLCYRLYGITKDTRWAEQAFQFAEKNKAFVLLESVKRNLAGNVDLQKDSIYRKIQSLQLQLAYLERKLSESPLDSVQVRIIEEKGRIEKEVLFANAALSRKSLAYKALVETDDSLSSNLVASNLLNENTGLIEFFASDSMLFAFVIHKNRPLQFIRYETGLSRKIDSLLVFYRTASAINNDPAGFQLAAYRVYHDLGFESLDKRWKNLVVIPDGKMGFVPFDALVTSATPVENLQRASWFINRTNTVYGYSVRILLKQKEEQNVANTATTVFAPVFANGENGQQPLVYTLMEAEAIARQKPVAMFLRENATLGNFKTRFEETGVLHVATHAYADTGLNHLPEIEFIDSSLKLNELYAMRTKASLVVLSACETAMGRISSSEGPMSLARGFYYAGAKNVIAGNWNIDDRSTSGLFSLFYGKTATNNSAEALYLAKKEFISQATGSFVSPYYWSGFVHYGMPQKPESKHASWWWLSIPLLFGIVYWMKRKWV